MSSKESKKRSSPPPSSSYISSTQRQKNKQKRAAVQQLAAKVAKKGSEAAMKKSRRKKHRASLQQQLSPKSAFYHFTSNNNNNNATSNNNNSNNNNNNKRNTVQYSKYKQYYYEQDDYISQFFPEDKRDEEPSVVLLGAGEGGKATIWKQVGHVYNQDFENEESRASWVSVIHHNVIMSMYSIVSYIRRTFTLPYDNVGVTTNQDSLFENEEELGELINNLSKESYMYLLHFTRFDDYEARLDCSLTPELLDAIHYLWNEEPLVRYIYRFHRHERYQLNDSAEFWFNSLDRISRPDFLPTLEDILKMRVKTTGVLEQRTRETTAGAKLNMILMGSQRNERKKWMTIIKDRRLTAAIFVIALSEFSQTLYENDTTNRLVESLFVFSEMINSHSLQDVPIYLFLNKTDVFTDKLQDEKLSCDLSRVFPELPRSLRKDYIKDKGVLLLPNHFDDCCFVQWEEVYPDESLFSINSPRTSSIFSFSSPRSNSLHSLHSPRSRSSVSSIISTGTSCSEYYGRVMLKTKLVRTRKASIADHNMCPVYKPKTDEGKEPFRITALSADEMGYVCLFLQVRDLCRLARVNSYCYETSGQDFIWRNLYYRTLLEARPTLIDNIDNITIDEQMVRQIYEDDLCNMNGDHSPATVSPFETACMWKYFVKFTSQNFYQKNITYILEELFTSTDRRDIQVFLTDATDSDGITSVLRKVIPEIAAREIAATLQKNSTVQTKPKKTSLISKIKSLFKR